MAKKPALVSISKSIAAAKEDAKNARERAKQFAEARPILAGAEHDAEMVAKTAARVAQCRYVNTGIWLYSEPELSVSFEVPVTSLKEGAIIAVLEAAMDLGFLTEETTDYVKEYCAHRTYRFIKRYENGSRCLLKITADVALDSESCRRIQTGVKLEEVPQFEMVCA
jgi:hypothetical protein